MKCLSFLLFVYILAASGYAGPNDRWVYVGGSGVEIDGIALLLAVGAFVWVYMIYRDLKDAKPRRR